MNKKTIITVCAAILCAVIIVLAIQWFSGSSNNRADKDILPKESTKLVLKVDPNDGHVIASACGFFINRDGYLLTTSGMCQASDTSANVAFYVVFENSDKKIEMRRCYVKRSDDSIGVACLRVTDMDGVFFRPLPLAENAVSGDTISILGIPADESARDSSLGHLREEYKIREAIFNGSTLSDRIILQPEGRLQDLINIVAISGNVSEIDLSRGSTRTFRYNAELRHGMYGSPIVNSKGAVVGISDWRQSLTGHKESADVSELRHFLENQNVEYVKPSSLEIVNSLSRLFKESSGAEIAVIVVCSLLAIGSIVVLIFVCTRGSSSQPVLTRYLRLSGTMENGQSVSYEISQPELQKCRSILIGASSEARFRLNSPYVSRRQAILHCDDGVHVYITNESSTNPTQVNGSPVNGRCDVGPGDKIVFGPITLNISVEKR